MTAFKPDPYVVEQCLRGINPALTWDERLDAIEAARMHDAASTVGCLSGLLGGILDAVEARTHGLVTAQELADDLAHGIRQRLYDQEAQ